MGNYGAWEGAGRALENIGGAIMSDALDERRMARLQKMEREAEELAYQRSMRRKKISGDVPTREREVVDETGKRFKVSEEREFNSDFSEGRWSERGRTPILSKPGRPYEVKEGNDIVTYQQNEGEDRKEIARAPRRMPGDGTPRPERAGSYARVRDPDDPDRWTYVDRQTGKYVQDEEGNRVEADPPYRERRGQKSKGFLGRTADALERGVSALSRAASRAAGKGKPVLTRDTEKKAESAGGDGAPKPGDIQDGYRFKGGDPADPSNWEKV